MPCFLLLAAGSPGILGQEVACGQGTHASLTHGAPLTKWDLGQRGLELHSMDTVKAFGIASSFCRCENRNPEEASDLPKAAHW